MVSFAKKNKTDVRKHFKSELGYKNDYAVPEVTKVVINTGFGRLAANTAHFESKLLPELMEHFALLSSQKPTLTKARKSIAGFKVREGQTVGMKMTLRGKRMHDFLDRLVHVVLPRVRDFRGIALKNFDKNGNLTIGIKEYTVFPEVPVDSVKVVANLEVTINTTAKNKEEAIALFTSLGFPLEKLAEKK